MAFVYHIHLPDDVGNFEKGYIGFTSKTVEHRYKEHKALAVKGEPYAVYNAIRKYGETLQVSTLVEGSNEYCLFIENKLRPAPNMAWNIAVGGGAPMLGKKHSDETKAKFKAADTPERRKKLSDFQKSLQIWQHGSSDKVVWASADAVYDCYVAHSCDIGPVLLARAFNLGKKKLEAMLRKFREGWNPSQDSGWIEWKIDQPTVLEGGWKPGDALVEVCQPEQTPELRAAKAKGGRNREWTDELREHMRQVNIGRTHTAEVKAKLSAINTGRRRTDEQRQRLSESRSANPWKVGGGDKGNWLNAEDMRRLLESGSTHADLLRLYGLDRKSGALNSIVKRLKAGWNPLEDDNWLAFKAEYEKEQHGS